MATMHYRRFKQLMSMFGKKRAHQTLVELPVAGFQHYRGESLWEFLRPGEPVQFKRHLANRHDKRAVAVYWRRNLIGYLPRTRNKGISDLLDIGEPLCGTIEELKSSENPWERVRIRVCRCGE